MYKVPTMLLGQIADRNEGLRRTPALHLIATHVLNARVPSVVLDSATANDAVRELAAVGQASLAEQLTQALQWS